jgi:hypothetical protein
MFPSGKETRLIVNNELVRIFRHLEHLGLKNYVIIATRRSEIYPLE